MTLLYLNITTFSEPSFFIDKINYFTTSPKKRYNKLGSKKLECGVIELMFAMAGKFRTLHPDDDGIASYCVLNIFTPRTEMMST